MKQRDVVVVANAFGADLIRRDGHVSVIAAVARCGARGFEVRRELIDGEPAHVMRELAALREPIAAAGLFAVLSVPDTLFDRQGAVDLAAVSRAVDEAAALGARVVKLQLGRPAAGWEVSLDALRGVLATSPARLVVENGQVPEGGTIADFLAAFAPLATPAPFGMTFDVGNWQWTGVDPLAAALALGAHVEYVHVKTVAGAATRRFAVAPAPHDSGLRALLAALPAGAPLGIEFPLSPLDHDEAFAMSGGKPAAPPCSIEALAISAKHHAAWLAAL